MGPIAPGCLPPPRIPLDHAAYFIVVLNIVQSNRVFYSCPNIAPSHVFSPNIVDPPRVSLLPRILLNRAGRFTASSSIAHSSCVFSYCPKYFSIIPPSLLEPAGATRIPRTSEGNASKVKIPNSACLNLPIQMETTTALEHIGMASESSLVDFNTFPPEFIAAFLYLYSVSTFSVL